MVLTLFKVVVFKKIKKLSLIYIPERSYSSHEGHLKPVDKDGDEPRMGWVGFAQGYVEKEKLISSFILSLCKGDCYITHPCSS